MDGFKTIMEGAGIGKSQFGGSGGQKGERIH
ncbi:hypothetical protein BSG1_18525 [Bacillus sp. SG-1]|nr:hypothetical protein BSG1_18525 [Bacillus sp. SG-1]